MVIFHLASLFVITESVLLFHEVVTSIFCLGPAHPDKAAEALCCKTMLSAISEGNRSWAKQELRKISKLIKRKAFFIESNKVR